MKALMKQLKAITKNYFLLSVSMVLLLFLMVQCGEHKEKVEIEPVIPNPTLPFRPNILWLVAEDQSPNIPSFGDSTVVTPTLDRLAAEGICYDNFFSAAAVCAPARASIITGMYPNSIGANHMRTGPWYAGPAQPEFIERMKKFMPEGLVPYEAVPPPEVKMFTEYLRSEGYYASNNAKEDYQFVRTMTAWDDSGREAHWRNRKTGQPFFSVFNFEVTHESRIWAKSNDSLWVAEDLDVPIPPYLPSTEIAQRDIRRMYSNILEMDSQVGKLLKELEDDGLLDSTIVMWYTDHGGPLPRQKRLLHESGIKVPLIIRYPGALHAGQRDDRMTSFIDLAPTVMSLIGIQPPDYMDGKAFLGKYTRDEEPQYIYAAADRFDAEYDQNRAVRDKRFKYIRYYQPEKPMMLPVLYRDQMPIMQELYRLKEAGELNAEQALWFRESKPSEELFDIVMDPHEVNNIAENPEYSKKLEELREVNNEFVKSIDDKGLIPEKELFKTIWPDGTQPSTVMPLLTINGDLLIAECATTGASIGYKEIREGIDANDIPYTVYSEPILFDQTISYVFTAQRIGYKQSEEVEWGF